MHNIWRHGPTGYRLRRETGWAERERDHISINYLQGMHCIYSCSIIELRWEKCISFFSQKYASQRGRVLMKKRVLGSLSDHGTDSARCHGSLKPCSVLGTTTPGRNLQAVLQKVSQHGPWRFCQGSTHSLQPHWHRLWSSDSIRKTRFLGADSHYPASQPKPKWQFISES